MPVIPATQEAESRRITAQSQPRQRVPKTLSRKTLHKNRAGRVVQGEGLSLSPSTTKKKDREREERGKKKERKKGKKEKKKETKKQRKKKKRSKGRIEPQRSHKNNFKLPFHFTNEKIEAKRV
jgi:hypothetical protein